MNELEMIVFQIISSIGTAKSMYMEALQLAKQGQFQNAKGIIDQAEKISIEGHKAHANMISQEAQGKPVIVSLLLAHAEDQLMSAEIYKEMVLEFISVYEKIEKAK